MLAHQGQEKNPLALFLDLLPFCHPDVIDREWHVLLVEDNAADAVLTIKELKEHPLGAFSVTHVRRLAEALGKLNADCFDVVLLDLGLPDSQGLATLERMHQGMGGETPILVLSGADDESLRLRALERGAEDYLVKDPSSYDARSRALRYAIERKRAIDAFRESRQQLAMAVEGACMGIFDWRSDTAKMTWSNHFARNLGFPLNQFRGVLADVERRVHPDDLSHFQSKWSDALVGGEEVCSEFRVIWPDGSVHWIESRFKARGHDRQLHCRMMGTVMDVSQKKAAQEAARRRDLEMSRLVSAHLTPREQTLLRLIAAGMPNKLIAVELQISIRTVAKHRAHLMQKTKALNAADLARICTVAGIVPGK
jgi:two-component system sensor histidine kinase UhpB